MAERRQARARATTDGQADGHDLTAAEAARQGRRQISELTGKEPEDVNGVEPLEDGWLVTVDVLEDRRIPSSTDLLSSYELEIGLDGELMSYRRVRRYTRGREESYRDDRNRS